MAVKGWSVVGGRVVKDGFVWVDLPAGDEDAVHVPSEVVR